MGFGIEFETFNTMMKKRFYTLVLIIPMALVSFENDDVELECDLSHQGMIVDWTGFDGCGLLIQVDSTMYEVINWSEINFIPQDRMEICFDFDFVEDAASICMAGPIITLTDCQVLE